jgi:AraC-like DNA-binding protein
MKINRRTKLVAGGAVLVAVAGGGAAVAASLDNSAGSESKAVIDDAAKQLGIPSSKLSDALKQALTDRVDAAVAAGRITKAEGDALKQRIASSDFPLFGGFHRGFGGHALFGHSDAAAAYIGITEAQLHTELEGGKSLAQVAQVHGKSVAGLLDALYADAKQRLDDAVTAGRLSKADETRMLDSLKQRIADLVNRTGADGQHFRPHGSGYRHFDGPAA